jgi:hypothetical protein
MNIYGIDKVEDFNNIGFIHLSDLHINNESKEKLKNLKEVIMKLKPDIDIKKNGGRHIRSKFVPIITGDIFDEIKYVSDTKCFELFLDFYEFLKDFFCNEPLLTYGNHDKSNMIENILPKKFISDDNKVIKDIDKKLREIFNISYSIVNLGKNVYVVLFDSSSESTNFARGYIEKKQIKETRNILKLDKDKHIFFALHHHVKKIDINKILPQISKKYGDISLINKIRCIVKEKLTETGLYLKNADEFFKDCVNFYNPKAIFHGHKHLPYFNLDDDISIISTISSTKGVDIKEYKIELGLNWLEYSLESKKIISNKFIFYNNKKIDKFSCSNERFYLY